MAEVNRVDFTCNRLPIGYENGTQNRKTNPQEMALEKALSKVEDLGNGRYLIPTHISNGEVTETKEVNKAGLVRYLQLQTTMLKGSTTSKLERTSEDCFCKSQSDDSEPKFVVCNKC